MLDTAGFVLVYAALAPYLFLFVPRARREAGAKLLLWVWAPAMLAGAMTAFTSADGYLSAPVGFTPALLVSGLLLRLVSGGRGDVRRPRRAAEHSSRSGLWPWLALVVLVAVVGVTVAFQFQFQQAGGAVRPAHEPLRRRARGGASAVDRRAASGPGRLRRDLQAQSRPGDALLVFYEVVRLLPVLGTARSPRTRTGSRAADADGPAAAGRRSATSAGTASCRRSSSTCCRPRA